MFLPKFSVEKPVATIMFYLAFFVLSVVALFRLAIDLMPEITFPTLAIITYYSGAGAEDIEQKITKPIESAVSIAPNLKELYSVSRENISVIRLNFEWGTNLEEAANDVRDRLDFVKRFLPEEAERPQLMKFDLNQIPVLFLGAQAKESYPKLNVLLDKKIADPLKRIPGVGNIILQGGLQRRINIEIDRQKLESAGLTLTEIIQALQANNLTLPTGTLKLGRKEYLLRVPGEFEKVEDE